MTETEYSRDFRSYDIIYFQLLSSFCSIAHTNIEDAQNALGLPVFVNSRLLSLNVHKQRIQSIVEAFIRTAQDNFSQVRNWIGIANQMNSFLIGTNMNFQMSLKGDQVLMMDTQYLIVTQITNED